MVIKALRLSPSGTYHGIIMSTKHLRRANNSSIVFFDGVPRRIETHDPGVRQIASEFT